VELNGLFEEVLKETGSSEEGGQNKLFEELLRETKQYKKAPPPEGARFKIGDLVYSIKDILYWNYPPSRRSLFEVVGYGYKDDPRYAKSRVKLRQIKHAGKDNFSWKDQYLDEYGSNGNSNECDLVHADKWKEEIKFLKEKGWSQFPEPDDPYDDPKFSRDGDRELAKEILDLVENLCDPENQDYSDEESDDGEYFVNITKEIKNFLKGKKWPVKQAKSLADNIQSWSESSFSPSYAGYHDEEQNLDGIEKMIRYTRAEAFYNPKTK